jgi:hypothetical protein
MLQLPQAIPDVDVLLSLSPEELAVNMLYLLRQHRLSVREEGFTGGHADPPQTRGRLTAGEVEGGADRQLPLARSGALGGIRRPPRGYSGLVPKSKNQTKICVPSCRSKVDLGACRNSRRPTCPDELCIFASTPTSMTPEPSDHRHVRRGATGASRPRRIAIRARWWSKRDCRHRSNQHRKRSAAGGGSPPAARKPCR